MFIALAPADNSCSHGGTLGCGFVKLTTAITSGASISLRFLDFDLGLRRRSILFREDSRNDVIGADAAFALEYDEPPWGELAVIGHARANGEDGLDLGRRGAGAAHLARFDRTA